MVCGVHLLPFLSSCFLRDGAGAGFAVGDVVACLCGWISGGGGDGDAGL